MSIRITQERGYPTKKQLDSLGNVIILVPDAGPAEEWPTFPYDAVLKRRFARITPAASVTGPLITDLPNDTGTRVTLSSVKPGLSAFELLSLARRHVAAQLAHDPRGIAIFAPGFDPAYAAAASEAMLAALLAGASPMPQYKSSAASPKQLATIRFLGVREKLNLRRALAAAEGNNLARRLTMLPPNELTPAIYLRRIRALARENGWRLRFLDSAALKRRRAGAFLAVARGSAERDAGIVHLRYTPPGRARRAAVALVGKGICFDTGGVNLKAAKHMHGMHEDMQGSAVALGTLLALTRLKVPYPVDCWLALAQNQIGPRAYRQNEVVTACNGTTIEVMHTDAEGRMVLADTLALASRDRPRLIIDYATLTGTCVYALSTRLSGAFTNRAALLPGIIEAGRDSGERVWPFPIDEDFDQDLESQIADIKQCTLEGEADHILAARFLSRFVGEMPWLHIDLAAGNRRGGLAHIPTDVTGFGVRFTLALLLDGKAV